MAEMPDLTLDPTSLTDLELSRWLLDAEAFRGQFESAYLATAGEWNARRAWAPDGALSGNQWLGHHAGTASSVARSRVRFATNLRRLDKTAAALAAGEISVEAAKAIALSWRPEVEAVLFEDEELLVSQAKKLSDDQFFRAIAYWRRVTDPADGSDSSAGDAKLHEQRRVHLSQTFQGAWVLDGLLEPEVGAILKTKLDEVAEELWRADQATLKAMAGDEADGDESAERRGEPVFFADGPTRAAGEEFTARTKPQRMADALGELARRGMPADDDPRPGRKPTINLTIDFATFIDRLKAGTGPDRRRVRRRRRDGPPTRVRRQLRAGGDGRQRRDVEPRHLHPVPDRGPTAGAGHPRPRVRVPEL